MVNQLVLSVFSGIDILGRGFKETGFCVVSAGDILFGQDIREFKSIAGRFDGIVGGSPCQDFSRARRTPPTGYGLEMIEQFKRVVIESRPKWFLLENVPCVPNIEIEGYQIQRFDLNANEAGSQQNRLRHFQFGSLDGLVLSIKRERLTHGGTRTVTASEGRQKDRRGIEDVCMLQGLEKDFYKKLKVFHKSGIYTVIGNAVNLNVSKRIAETIKTTTDGANAAKLNDVRLCRCGCGRILTGRQTSAGATCRKRVQKQKESVIKPGVLNQAESQ